LRQICQEFFTLIYPYFPIMLNPPYFAEHCCPCLTQSEQPFNSLDVWGTTLRVNLFPRKKVSISV
jgi:hypothetical protein